MNTALVGFAGAIVGFGVGFVACLLLLLDAKAARREPVPGEGDSNDWGRWLDASGLQ